MQDDMHASITLHALNETGELLNNIRFLHNGKAGLFTRL